MTTRDNTDKPLGPIPEDTSAAPPSGAAATDAHVTAMSGLLRQRLGSAGEGSARRAEHRLVRASPATRFAAMVSGDRRPHGHCRGHGDVAAAARTHTSARITFRTCRRKPGSSLNSRRQCRGFKALFKHT